MGTLAGIDPATGDTIGVAWGAQWIAANAIDQSVGLHFENDVYTCYQWFIDPDGNPNTVDDVPDVVQNAWGVNETLGYPDCDPTFWPAIDACEAAGIATVWTAGSDGPAPQTIRSPGDRATTAYNCFSVGAVDAAYSGFPYPVTSFSSRGPSGCNVSAPLKIKPEVTAPGVDIYSSVPGGTYQIWSGTAMASAHAGGVVALLRSADPDLEVDAIKEILMATARDEGPAGDDNSYGWGVIDAWEAMMQLPIVSVSPADRTGRTQLLANWPNPFSEATTLRFRLASDGPATLTVYDAAGRPVRTIVARLLPAGEHMAIWDGRDASSHRVTTGVYFCGLRTTLLQGQRKLLLMR